jgi:hypothetical protein
MPRRWTRNPPHGTRSRYDNYLCRCELCTQANRDYQRAYQQRPERRVKAKLSRKSRGAPLESLGTGPLEPT